MNNTKNIFITATNTDIGKTYASELFLKYYANKGLKVGYYKPIETGVIDLPIDGNKMLNLVKELNPNFDVSINDVVPYQFELPAAPYVAKKDLKIDINLIIEKKKYLESLCDILIIEGAGGLLVPIEKDFFIIDLIKKLKTKAILICPSRLGSINDSLLSQEALKNRKIDFDWYINLYEDKESFEEVTLPFYKDYFKTINFLDDLKD
ncbi:dethiobiotin synthase [Arcobacter sp. LA11]|uniref:dethiobiotin synthase n=1 Tax=Arcobacter sp. LA11 TaxID=1898176 RepID=UPI00093460E2|nr:dethiobiotin synthase [Arcobacter sp. LA11]